MNAEVFKSGCTKQSADIRDHVFKPKFTYWADFNDIDLRPRCRTPRKQGNIASCTAFAVTSLFDFVRRKINAVNWNPSPLFTYYTTRSLTNDEMNDVGATVKDALKSTAKFGVSMERAWPYNEENFNVRPPEQAYIIAEKHQTLEYLKINDFDKNAWLNCLNDGYPFAFGLNLYSSFFDPIMQLMGGYMIDPDRDNEKLVGAHCMLAVGYIKNYNNKEYLIVQNSWGTNWGDQGYCYIPLSYIMTNDSFDFWTIRLTETSSDDDADPVPTTAPTPVLTAAPTSTLTTAQTSVVVPAPENTPGPPTAPVDLVHQVQHAKRSIMFFIVISISALVILTWLAQLFL